MNREWEKFLAVSEQIKTKKIFIISPWIEYHFTVGENCHLQGGDIGGILAYAEQCANQLYISKFDQIREL